MAGLDSGMDIPPLPQLPETSHSKDNPESIPPLSRGSDTGRFLFSGNVLRDYQAELARPGVLGQNYIICAPTGSGKTAVAAFIVSDHLQRQGGRGKIVFLVNKVPLAEQQKTEIQRYVKDVKIAAIVGDMPVELKTMINNHDVVVCTAGVFVNGIRESQSGARVKLKDLSLLIIDECHHTKKNSPYATVMIHYLRKKFGKKKYNLPQVIGLTATPGTGDAKIGDLIAVVDHMVGLCAHMDASAGIKTVEDEPNKAELLQYTQNNPLRMIPVHERSTDTPFFKMIAKAMDNIEESLGEHSPHGKSDQGYENWVVQRINNTKIHDSNPQDKLSALEYLRWFSVALTIYADLNEEHALKVMEEHLTPNPKATEFEKILIQYRERVFAVGARSPTESPLLRELRERLSSEFKKKSYASCQGIVFCRTKHHARCLGDWVKKDPELLEAGVRVGIVTGHIREGNAGMNRVEQQQVIDEFRRQKLNLLIATTVLEEGFDVPACNLVIRLHVTNEIARKQAHGRARAEESECFTILTAGSKKEYQEMQNKEREKMAELAFEYLPRGEDLLLQIQPIQLSILEEKKKEKKALHAKKSIHDPGAVKLLCGKCKAFACKATDVKTLNSHYVVPSKDFQDKYKSRPHAKPQELRGIVKNEKIACVVCDKDWGVQCVWKRRENAKLPVLKCDCFIYEIDGCNRTFRKWSTVPFHIADYDGARNSHDSDDSSSDDSD